VSAAPEAFSADQEPRDDGSVLVVVRGELDLARVPQLRAMLSELASGKRPTTLDLSGLVFMDSTGLHLLLDAAGEAQRDGWSFALTGELSAPISRLFDMTGTRAVLPFDRPEP
jgi:anti-sigma B factor antagonist